MQLCLYSSVRSQVLAGAAGAQPRQRLGIWARLFGGCAIGLLLASGAAAQGTAPSGTGPVGNPTVGQGIAQNGLPPAVAACASCHGARGEGSGDTFPPLAGNGAAYLRAQLEAFADGSRVQPIMHGIAKGLSAQQRADVAAFYAGQARAYQRVAVPAPHPDDTGAWLVERGRWSQGIPACTQCHGPGGLGVGEHFPALAGLSASYMQAQFAALRQGTRPPGPLQLMGRIAQGLSAQDVAAVAAYYARLHSAPAPASRPGAADAAPPGGSKP